MISHTNIKLIKDFDDSLSHQIILRQLEDLRKQDSYDESSGLDPMTQGPPDDFNEYDDNEEMGDKVYDEVGEREEEEGEGEGEGEEEEEEEEEFDGPENLPAEAGVIEKLTLKNFMCHDFFELELGPQINFIIGRNGSGKSAILTGISVGLGAKANDTNRGSSIRDLIKDGKSMSRITIVLKNDGSWAYRPEEYGRKIIIERKLQRVGTNSYSIKDERGKTVSTKKATLDEILYQFNITVDNPLAFLSQDKAREFLTSATARTKFEYFMDGAFITDIYHNLDLTQHNLKEIKTKMNQAKAYKDTCKEEYRKAAIIHNSHMQHNHLRDKLKTLGGKIRWYNVKTLEDKIGQLEAKIVAFELQILQRNEEIKMFDEELELKRPEQSRLEEEEAKAENEVIAGASEVENLRDVRAKIKTEIDTLLEDMRSNIDKIGELERDIVKARQAIERERAKIEEQQGGSKEQMKEQLEKVRLDVQQCEEKIENTKIKYKEIDKAYESRVEELRATKQMVGSKLQDLRQQQVQLDREQNSRYLAWGANRMQKVMRDIDRATWIKKPIGPVGSYVLVKKEFKSWVGMLDAILTKTLDSFIVSDERDRPKLAHILRANHLFNHNIIVRKNERFQYSSGKAAGTTVVDMIDVEDEDILYALIDTNSIEKLTIASSQEEARRLCRMPNVYSVLIQFGPDSGKRVTYNGNLSIDPVYYLSKAAKFGSANKNDLMEEIMSGIRLEQLKLNEVERDTRTLNSERDSEKEVVKRELQQLKQKHSKLKLQRSVLEDKIEAEVDLRNINNLELRIEDLGIQIERLEQLNKGLEERNESNKEKGNSLKRQTQVAKDKLRVYQQKRNACHEAKTKNLLYIQTYEDKRKECLLEITKLEHEIESSKRISGIAEPKLVEERVAAEKLCTREEAHLTDRDTPESMEKDFRVVQEQIQEAERRMGSNLEDILKQVELTSLNLKAAEANERDLKETFERLCRELAIRYNFLTTTINHQVSIARRSFESSMELRGFKGSMNMNFSERSLEVLVKTKQDIERNGIATAGRTVESLSGGEKSYTQIALLLAIWQTMSSKIRGLDEFDVYMDSVNRSISIRLLLSNLMRYPKSQNIFITPQDIAVVGDLDNPCVKIHKMSDPRKD